MSMQFHKPNSSLSSSSEQPPANGARGGTGTGTGAPTESKKERAVSPAAPQVRPEAISLQIRELDTRMTGFREEKHKRQLQIDADRKELEYVHSEISRIQKMKEQTASRHTVHAANMGSMEHAVGVGKKEIVSVNRSATELLQRAHQQMRIIQQKNDRDLASERPTKRISTETMQLLARESASSPVKSGNRRSAS
eukprot:ANDGO_06387.mRNA.1 hypothetical protein